MTVQPTRDQLRALADKASRGPWTVDDGGGYDFSVTQGGDGDYIACDVTPRDAAFIAAARTAVPQLLDQLDAAEARLQAIRDLHHPWGDTLTHTTICDSCDDAYPCPTVRALESVPPPSA